MSATQRRSISRVAIPLVAMAMGLGQTIQAAACFSSAGLVPSEMPVHEKTDEFCKPIYPGSACPESDPPPEDAERPIESTPNIQDDSPTDSSDAPSTHEDDPTTELSDVKDSDAAPDASPPTTCGDAECDPGEQIANCPEDCPEPPEDEWTCFNRCGLGPHPIKWGGCSCAEGCMTAISATEGNCCFDYSGCLLQNP